MDETMKSFVQHIIESDNQAAAQHGITPEQFAVLRSRANGNAQPELTRQELKLYKRIMTNAVEIRRGTPLGEGE